MYISYEITNIDMARDHVQLFQQLRAPRYSLAKAGGVATSFFLPPSSPYSSLLGHKQHLRSSLARIFFSKEHEG